MSDERDKSGNVPADGEQKGPLAGERLAEARQAQQIPVVDIAKELHLDEYKVLALERNEFDVLDAPVFAKGHLRKYAQLVQVSEADVMADYYQLDRAASVPLIISTRPKPRKELSPGPWIVAVSIVALLVATYWWFGVRENTPVDEAADEVSLLPQIEERDVQASNVVVDLPTDETGETDQPPETERPPVVEPSAETELPTESPTELEQLQLSVSFSGDSWTEITDANGRRLFFGLGSAGRTINLSGEAPFNVLLGNAANASLLVNGDPFEIPAGSRRGRIARLTIQTP